MSPATKDKPVTIDPELEADAHRLSKQLDTLPKSEPTDMDGLIRRATGR